LFINSSKSKNMEFICWCGRTMPDNSDKCFCRGDESKGTNYGTGQTVYMQNYLTSEEADRFYGLLQLELEYHRREDLIFKVFGKEQKLPRDIATYSDSPELKYEFGVDGFPDSMEWTPTLKEILYILKETTGINYNHAVINRYKNGQDYIGFHKDKTTNIDFTTNIAVLSFGASRSFRIKDIREDINDKFDIEHGSLLVMDFETNAICKHSIAKTAKKTGERISITLRRFVA
jgi:alkylated DNA repair dioxygenase AlkB